MKNHNSNKKRQTYDRNFIKWMTLLHVLFSIIWLGGILCLGILISFRPESTSEAELRYLNEVFHRIDMTHVATTPILSLITGLILCCKTKWRFLIG